MDKDVKIEICDIEEISFKELMEGSFFGAPTRDNKSVYMKMTWCWSDPNDSGVVRNAVNVSTGAATSFDDEEKVIKLKGTMKFQYK